MPSDRILLQEKQAGATNRQIAEKWGLNPDSVRARVSRATRKQIEPPKYSFTGDEETWSLNATRSDQRGGMLPVFDGHLRLHADEIMIAGDLHIPSTNYPLAEAMTEMALKHMKPPRSLLICGDLSNGDQDSVHAPLAPSVSRARELVMLEDMLSWLLVVFDFIWITPGNHLRNRLMKKLAADMTANQIKRMFTPPDALDRVNFSWYDMVEIHSGGEEWLVTHQYQYRQTKLSIANELAQKYQRNVITFHQHHTASGIDKYERYGVIDCGGLHDQTQMAYVQLVPSVRPRMNSGFVYLRNGTGNLMTPYKALTDWSVWNMTPPWERAKPNPMKMKRKTQKSSEEKVA